MPDSPNLKSGDVINFTIKSGGQRISDTYEVMAILTRNEVNRIPEAVITLTDGDPASLEFPVTDSNTFKPGAEIEIQASWDEDPATRIFSGLVTGVRYRFKQGVGVIEVRCRDKAMRLMQSRKAFTYNEIKDSDLIIKLIADAGLSADVASTSEKFQQSVQSHTSDWDFVLARAETNGLVVTMGDGKITVKAPDTSAAPVMSLTYGQDIIDFDAELDAIGQYKSYEFMSWDSKTQAMASASQTAEATSLFGNLSASTLASVCDADNTSTTASSVPQAFLSTLASSRRLRASLGALRGQVCYQGSTLASPGTTIEITGMAERFSGKAYVSGVVHRIENGNWITEAALGLDAEWNIERDAAVAPRSGLDLRPPLHGLQVGKVVKLSEDPESLSRIQIKLPHFGSSSGGALLWARFAAPYASNKAGVTFLPEIDDEVVVGFMDADPDVPVVLGSLHNPNAVRPLEVDDEKNNIKVVQTRSGLKVEFDEEKKKITLTTPKGNTVTLDDDAQSIVMKDMAGNSATLDQGGITLDSKSDVSIKAVGNVTISATGDAEMSGANVEVSGELGVKVKGGADAELSAGGMTKVAGALVQIN